MAQTTIDFTVVKIKKIDTSVVKTIGTESHGKIDLTAQLNSRVLIPGIEKTIENKFNLNLASKNILDIELSNGEVVDTNDTNTLLLRLFKKAEFEFPSVTDVREEPEFVAPRPEVNETLRLKPVIVPSLKPNPLKPGLIIPNSSNPLLRSGTDIFGGGTGRVVLDVL